jgi:hypothetical protein
MHSISEEGEAAPTNIACSNKPRGKRKGILRRWSYFQKKTRAKPVVPTRSGSDSNLKTSKSRASWATLPSLKADVLPVMETVASERAARQTRRQSTRERIDRANSTDSIYTVEDTIQIPNDNRLLESQAKVLHALLEANKDNESVPDEKDPFECASNRREIEVQEILSFLTEAFRISQWSTECNIIALVLITRLNERGYIFRWRNWNRVTLCALIVAQKIWDDSSIGTIDVPFIWQSIVPDATNFSCKDATRMEQCFLNNIGWNTHVNRQVYTKVYFELREIGAADREDDSPLKPLTDKELEVLEIRISKGAELLTQQEKASCVQNAPKTAPSKYAALGDRKGRCTKQRADLAAAADSS